MCKIRNIGINEVFCLVKHKMERTGMILLIQVHGTVESLCQFKVSGHTSKNGSNLTDNGQYL